MSTVLLFALSRPCCMFGNNACGIIEVKKIKFKNNFVTYAMDPNPPPTLLNNVK